MNTQDAVIGIFVALSGISLIFLGGVFAEDGIKSDCEHLGQFRSGDIVYTCEIKKPIVFSD